MYQAFNCFEELKMIPVNNSSHSVTHHSPSSASSSSCMMLPGANANANLKFRHGASTEDYEIDALDGLIKFHNDESCKLKAARNMRMPVSRLPLDILLEIGERPA